MNTGKKLTALVLMGVIIMGLFGCGKNTDNTKEQDEKQPLTSFTYSSGGGMSGGGDSLKIYTEGDTTYMSIASSEWWYEDDKVTEYIVEREALDKIEAVFKKYGMKKWHNKVFTNMFVDDGPSYSYDFRFGKRDGVHFSSQIYPSEYRKKLDPIHDVIDECKKTGKLLPGLVTKEISEEEILYRNKPNNGRVELEVYKYETGNVYYRVMNGTGEEVTLSTEIVITDENSKEVICKEINDYNNEVSENYSTTETVSPKKRLEVGKYRLTIGEYSCLFEIELPSLD